MRRQSGTEALLPSEVVLDDIIELGPGDQIVVDGEIVEEANLEVDESLLTGEADPIAKDAGDTVMSGSFVVAGSGAYRATKVGREAYAAKLAEEASKFTLVKSELRSGINKILQFITYLLVPAGLLTIYTQLFTTDAGWRRVGAAHGRCAGADGARRPGADDVDRVRRRGGPARAAAVPGQGAARHRGAGPRRRGVRRQDRHTDRERHAGIGSRTHGCDRSERGSSRDVLAQLAADDPRPNASMQAIAEAYKMPPGWTATATAPFKSATKWSGASYGEHGNWVIGAPDVLLDPASRGRRAGRADRRRRDCGCCCSARSDLPVDDPDAPGTVTPVALVVLEQRVRPDARDTLDYFASQKVSVKVISGDNAVSVGAVAGSLGLQGETMDARAAARRARRSWPTPSRSTPRSAGCGPTRSAPWCTPCSRAGTPSR